MSDKPENSMDVEEDWGAALDEQAGSVKSAREKISRDGIFKDLSGQAAQKESNQDIEFILDLPVLLTVELGRTKIVIKNLLQLTQGSVVELNGLAGEPMDVLVNGCLIAQGEVVVVNEKFGIRLTDITSPAERIRKLNR